MSCGVGTKNFSAEAAGKGSNVNNYAEVIKLGFWGEGKTLGKGRYLRGGEKLRREINNRVGRGVRSRVSVGRRGLKFGEEGSWYMKRHGKTENGGKTGTFGKRVVYSTRLKGKELP